MNSSPQKILAGKTALVTGSSSGIGLAIARGLAQAGAQVMLNGLDGADKLQQLAQALSQETGVKVLFSQANMAKSDEIAQMIAQTKKDLGTVDVLVNNAGVQHVSPVEDFPPEKWDLILAVNLSSAFHTSRAVVPAMKAKKWGRIINTASAHSLVASPFKAAYVSAKHGLAGLTKTLALELAQFGVTANCISPGYVWTPLVEKQIPDTMAARGLTKEQVIQDVLLHAQPTKQFVTVEQVAALALYLCSDAAAQMTGANLALDGGWTAQ
jgi:3-hydroxybutyrate dehydrogenase